MYKVSLVLEQLVDTFDNVSLSNVSSKTRCGVMPEKHMPENKVPPVISLTQISKFAI